MEQYISKSDVLAWIKNRLLPTVDPNADDWEMGADAERVNILNFIKSLEVKEVDLEKEIDKELETRWRGEYLFVSKFRESAKHFFELGMKAQNRKE